MSSTHDRLFQSWFYLKRILEKYSFWGVIVRFRGRFHWSKSWSGLLVDKCFTLWVVISCIHSNIHIKQSISLFLWKHAINFGRNWHFSLIQECPTTFSKWKFIPHFEMTRMDRPSLRITSLIFNEPLSKQYITVLSRCILSLCNPFK